MLSLLPITLPGFANMNVYYQTIVGKKKKLNVIAVDTNDHCDAIYEVMHMLHDTQEKYLRPVVALVHGAKK